MTANYSTGAVSSLGNTVGGLIGGGSSSVFTDNYWDTLTSGRDASAGGVGQTTEALKSPTGYTGIYADWNVDVDRDGSSDDPWHFGTSTEYPKLKHQLESSSVSGASLQSISQNTRGSLFDGARLAVNVGNSGTGQPVPLADLRVSPGRVWLSSVSAGTCIRLGNTPLNGSVYTVHGSKWQHRAGTDSPWVDVPAAQNGGLCAHTPSSAGEYRILADMTVGGQRGIYSSGNTITVR